MQPQPVTPYSLLVRLQRYPSQKDWTEFVILYEPMIRSLVVRLKIDTNDVDDLTQNVFVCLLQKLASYQRQEGQRFRSWLSTVIYHACMSFFRQRKRSGNEGLDQLPDDRQIEEATRIEEEEFNRYLVQRTLNILRSSFDSVTREIFEAVVLHGEPRAEVAARFDKTINAVYGAVHRVLQALRATLVGFVEEEHLR